MDLICKNVTLVHCSVVVYNYVLPFFLYLNDCVVILKFGSIVSCGLTRETRPTRHKPIAWRTCLLDYMKYFILTSDPFTWWSHSNEIWSTVWENRCLSITRAAGLLEKVCNLLKSRPKNYLINYIGVSLYCHLNQLTKYSQAKLFRLYWIIRIQASVHVVVYF